jgi:hypothetical protein
MPNYLITLMLLTILALPAWAQEEESAGESADTALPEADTVAAEEVDGAAESDAEEADDSDLDIQTYEEDDDVFVPTEEIPADEPIPFPSNI